MCTRLRVLVAGVLGLGLLAPPARGDGDLSGWPLVPVSGADGAFETVTAGGVTSWRSLRDGTGSFAPYLYFRVPDAARALEGPVYV